MQEFSSKDPADVDKFAVGFGPALRTGETISSPTVTIAGRDSALTIVAGPSVGDGTDDPIGDVIVKLAGGTPGGEYTIQFSVTTSQGRTLRRSAGVLVTYR